MQNTGINLDDKRYTIKDIAQQLNLSKSTVSRALRDSYDVSAKTKQKVMKLVKKLDFEPNAVAMNLRQHKTLTIGVVIPSFRIPFYSTAICGIHEAAANAGYNVMICQNEESYESEIINVNSLIKSRVDGLIISFSKKTSDYDHILKIQRKDFPVVLFNRISDELNLPSVSVDDYESAYDATNYLAKRGCKHIAHITGPDNLKLSQDRKSGFIQCLKDRSLRIRESWIVESDFSIESGKKATEYLLSLPVKPDAIFCVCDAVAFGVMMVLKNKGIRIPQDISVMGYTDEPVAVLVDPPLTTVTQPIFEIGKRAGQLLIDVINRKTDRSQRSNIQLRTSIVERRSTI